MDRIMYPKIRIPLVKNPRRAYLIKESARDNNGRYLPLIAIEFQDGFVIADGALSPDKKISQKIVDLKNKSIGLSKKEANKIIASTRLEFVSLN